MIASVYPQAGRKNKLSRSPCYSNGRHWPACVCLLHMMDVYGHSYSPQGLITEMLVKLFVSGMLVRKMLTVVRWCCCNR